MTVSTAPITHGDVFKALDGYFRRSSPASAPAAVSADTQLIGSGLLDSLSMLELTVFLSDTFGIEFEDDDFTAENFDTAGRLAELVASKSEAAA